MPTLNCLVSKERAEENSSSPTIDSAEKSVLPPFSGKLCVDEKLYLSNDKFKQTIYDYFKDKNLTPQSQLTATLALPTPHVMAQFASKAYTDYKKRETDAHYGTRLGLPDGWKLLTTASNSRKSNGYFGAAYWHPEHQQVVIAHRGTDLTNLGALWTDIVGVLFKHHVPQMSSASTFAYEVVEVLKLINQEKGVQFQVFFTGHSLGGWLAQITNFTTKYLDRKENTFLKSENVSQRFHLHTVVFDSPGCKDMLSQMADELDVLYDGRSIDLEHLDITSYLSAPNRINTCNKHVGTVYRIFTDLSDMSWWEKHSALYNLATHRMDKILEAFDNETGQVHEDEHGKLKIQVVVDWPITAGLSRSKKYKSFFEWAKHFNNYHPKITDETLKLKGYNQLRYQTKTYDERVTSVNKFSYEERQFLNNYCQLCQLPDFFKPKELFSALGDNQAQKAEKMLQSFEIENQTIRCTDCIELQSLIAYVKSLTQLFPEIIENTKCALSPNEIRNNVYQIGTKHYLEKFQQSPLEFKPDALTLRDFLNSDQEKVLQLQMVDGDAWTGLIKVYKVLEKTGLLSEGHYTVLTLEHLLPVNRMVNFNTFLESTTAPHLLMMMCETTHIFNEERRQILRSLFITLKKKSVKIILTTQLEDDTVNFLQGLAKETIGNGLVTRNEEITWCDLSTNTQEKLLEKTVKFQNARISLNELMSAESAAAKFLPLRALLQEEELTIADPLPISNAYNEIYYIGRTFRYQKVIKQDIFNDKDVRDSQVYLARTEEEYRNLCQLHPTCNVHLVQIDMSGEFVWHQSQGSLGTPRKFIDTENSRTYTTDDLETLWEQAKHQRVMLISDTAGMGKSTVLTHLSQKIKQKFPAKWVVRIDINDHTRALNALKQEQIDKEKVIKFVRKKVLKLKRDLEMELFKECCEQKQKVRIVIMLDGFDEISPLYKETVIDLLQALRQTAVEQLWVTTRPHLREELEDKLQQLSYTLEPFSEENQIEFLEKFWRLNDWFTEPGNKDEEVDKNKLQIYAKHLINELANSISDNDIEFTGIPLQTRMLAEAYEEEVKIFYQSAGSTPKLLFKLDLLALYNRFIERKYYSYQEEKLQVPVNSAYAKEQRERELTQMRKHHQLLALQVLFHEEQVTLFQNNKETFFSTEELTRIGIVQISHDGKLHFIHLTFAEYYVADCLVSRLTEGNNFAEQVQYFILKGIFHKTQYKVIRVFVDGLLSRNKPPKEVLKQYAEWIKNPRNYALITLNTAAEEDNVNIVKFLLDIAKATGLEEAINKLWRGKSKCNTATAWDLAAERDCIRVLQKLWQWAEEKLTTAEIKNEILFRTEYGGRTIFHVAENWSKLDLMQKMWDWTQENLTTEELTHEILLSRDNRGRTFWLKAINWDKQNLIQKIWEWAEKKLTTDELKREMLLRTDPEGLTVWVRAVYRGNQNLLQKIWEWAKENLKPDEIKREMLLHMDNLGRTIWYLVQKWDKLHIMYKMWEWAQENLTTEEIKDVILLRTHNEGTTVWLNAVYEGNQDLFQNIWEWAEDKLTTEEIKDVMLLRTHNKGRTAWLLAAYKGNQDVLQKICEWAEDKLTSEEIKNEILLSTDNEGWTVWHVAAYEGKVDVIKKTWEWAEGKLTREELIYEMLLRTDNKGRTAWHVAAYWGKPDILQNFQCVSENLTTQEIKKYQNLGTDNEGKTAWHMPANHYISESLQKLLEWVNEKLTTQEIKNNLLLGTDNEGKTAWHLAAKNSNSEILQKLWELANEKLTAEEIKNNLLLGTDIEGKTAWHLAANHKNSETLQKLWELANEKLTKEEIKNNLLLGTDNEGKTVWQLAANHNNSETLKKLWEMANEKLTTEELKGEMLLRTDREGMTVWVRAVYRGNQNLLQKIWEWAKENLKTDEIKNKMLLRMDNLGRTIWYLVQEWEKLHTMYKMWEWAQEILTTEEIKDVMLLRTHNEGRTVLLDAVYEGNKYFFKKIWEWAEDKLTTEEIKDVMLLRTHNEGRTVWHLAAYKGNLDILQKICEWAEDKLKREEIKNEILLRTDNEGLTVWHVAAKEGREGVLKKMWEWAEGKLTREELKYEILLRKDNKGRTACHVTDICCKIEIFQKFFCF